MTCAFVAARALHRGRRPQCGRIGRIYYRHGSAGEKGAATGPVPTPTALAPLLLARRRLRPPCPPPAPHPPMSKRRFAPPCAMRWSTGLPAPHPPMPRRTRSAIAAISLTALLSVPNVAPPDTCPLCGGASIRRAPLLDRLREVRVPVVGGSVGTRESGEKYLKCHGCTAEFVHTDRDIKTIMNGLVVQDNVPAQIEHYYKRRIRVADLLTRHRTAIIRRVSARRSMLGVSTAKRELIICFMYRGVRTYGTFVRESDPERGVRYVFTELSME